MATWQGSARLLLFEDICREQVRRGHSVYDRLLNFFICAHTRQVVRGHRQHKHLINSLKAQFSVKRQKLGVWMLDLRQRVDTFTPKVLSVSLRRMTTETQGNNLLGKSHQLAREIRLLLVQGPPSDCGRIVTAAPLGEGIQ
jgi:hypothetical protein